MYLNTDFRNDPGKFWLDVLVETWFGTFYWLAQMMTRLSTSQWLVVLFGLGIGLSATWTVYTFPSSSIASQNQAQFYQAQIQPQVLIARDLQFSIHSRGDVQLKSQIRSLGQNPQVVLQARSRLAKQALTQLQLGEKFQLIGINGGVYTARVVAKGRDISIDFPIIIENIGDRSRVAAILE